MEHKEYWRERFKRLEKAQNQNGVTYQKRVAKEYDKAIKAIERDVGEWYARFATTEGITLAEAKKKLSKRQLKAFRMSVEEYVEKGESLDPKWAAELERASVKFHVSRLEALKLQLQQEAERVSGEFSKSFDDFARNAYSEHYYRTAYEIQKGLKLGWDVMRLDRNRVDKVVRKPWAVDGRNFSERVWANRSKLVNELHTTLTQSIIRGSDPQKAINALSKRMDVSKHAAGRLIMTENAFFASAAEKDVFEALEVERYEILATLDSRTSQICRDMDGKVFKQSEFEVGVTAPPFHVYCRSTTVPYFDDEFTEGEKRAARDKDGKYYEVPANMTYREWEKTFVEGGSKEGLKPVEPEKIAPKLNWVDEIKSIRSKGDSINESDVLRAGEIFLTKVKEEIPSDVFSLGEQIDKLAREREKLLDENWEKYRKIMPDYDDPTYVDWREKRKKENDKIKDEYDYKIQALRDRKKSIKDDVKRLLSEIRPMGYDDKLVSKHLMGSKKMRPVMEKAYQYYPSDWVKNSLDHGKLKIIEVQRGYYSHGEGKLALSGFGGDQTFSTAIHELGHRFEQVSDLVRWERIFYDRRTNGESLAWMGKGYGKNEKTRKDHFINSYIGKDYGGYAYEVVSMGFQYAITDLEKLLEDEDFAKFIFGLLTVR